MLTKEHTIWAKLNAMYWISINGDVLSFGERSGYLKPIINVDGYVLMVAYYKDSNKSVRHRVHRVVAGLFLKGPKLPQVNHLDGVKINNRLENLEWATNTSNQKHAWATGLQPRTHASKPSLHALTQDQMIEVKALRETGMSYIKIGKLFGVSNGTIRRVCINQFAYGDKQ